MSRVKLRVSRAMLYAGQPVQAGAILTLDPTAAADVIDSGKAELIDAADWPAVLAARRAEVAAVLKHQRQLTPQPGPWMPAGQWH